MPKKEQLRTYRELSRWLGEKATIATDELSIDLHRYQDLLEILEAAADVVTKDSQERDEAIDRLGNSLS